MHERYAIDREHAENKRHELKYRTTHLVVTGDPHHDGTKHHEKKLNRKKRRSIGQKQTQSHRKMIRGLAREHLQRFLFAASYT